MAAPEVLPSVALTCDLATDTVRDLNQRLHLAAEVGRVRVLNPNGKQASRSASTPSTRSRSRATSATTARG